MGRARTATRPIFQFMESDVEETRDPPDRIVILLCRPMQRAPRVIGYLSHLFPPFSKALKISLISFPPPKLEGRSLIFPSRNIFHPNLASFRKSLVFDLTLRMRLSS